MPSAIANDGRLESAPPASIPLYRNDKGMSRALASTLKTEDVALNHASWGMTAMAQTIPPTRPVI